MGFLDRLFGVSNQADSNNGKESGAVTALRDRASQGDVEAQFLLGSAYYNGEGISKDLPCGINWWKRAAEQGHAKAQLALGTKPYMPIDRLGIPAYLPDAVHWLRLAADQGEFGAYVPLGNAYRNGFKKMKPDTKESLKWYTVVP